jgi:hypothetical protein
MQNVQKIDSFLRQHQSAYYCDRCLSKLTGVKPPNQVNQTTRPHSLNPIFSRKDDQECANCGSLRTCVAYIGGAGASTQN